MIVPFLEHAMSELVAITRSLDICAQAMLIIPLVILDSIVMYNQVEINP